MPSSNHLIETSPVKLVFLILVGGLHPGDALGLLGPEPVGVASCALVHLAVLLSVHQRVSRHLGLDREEVRVLCDVVHFVSS